MIAVFALCRVQADKTEQFEKIAAELAEKSRQDKGCVSYQCGKLIGQENSYAFVEQWASKADLDEHMTQPHFLVAVERFADVLAAELEINMVDYL